MVEPHIAYRALRSRDRRFDGVFFVGVTTTGIYCRPVCTARPARRDRCVFFDRPVDAEREGFRACLRCRPELAPGNAPSDAVSRLVRAAVARVDAGYLNEASVDDLARELGVSDRHLRRAMEAEIGTNPIELAQSHRLSLAKRLLHDTSLPITDIAFSSGFASIRRFNALFGQRFGRPPSALRRGLGSARASDHVRIRLDYRPPLDWDALLAFLARHAIPGVERVEDGRYLRTVRVGSRSGWLSVERDATRPALIAHVSLSLAGSLMRIVARLRRLFDLDAHPTVIAEALGRDARLRPQVRRHPGIRVVGAFDGFETACSVVMGQQVSVRAANTLLGRIAKSLGRSVSTPFEGLTLLFPSAEDLASQPDLEIARLGMPLSRARTILAIAKAVAAGALNIGEGSDPDALIAESLELGGVGRWTAQVLAMRVAGWPDAFPSADLGLRRAARGLSAVALERRAETWRPWRAYAAAHLWASLFDEVRT